MAMRPFTRLSGLPSDNGNALSEELGFAPGMTEAPPVATDILLQFSPGADPAQVKAALQAVNGQQAELVRAGDAEAGPLLRLCKVLGPNPRAIVLGLSMFTNYAAGMSDEALSHAHTLATAQATAALAQRLLSVVVPALVLS